MIVLLRLYRFHRRSGQRRIAALGRAWRTVWRDFNLQHIRPGAPR